MPRNSSLVDSIDLNNAAAASQPSMRTHWNFVCELTNRPCVRRAQLGASRGTPATLLLGAVYAAAMAASARCRRRRGGGVGAPPRSHEAARDLMTRARFRLERVSVSKNEQSASQACLTLQCTAFEKRPHITSGGF